MKPGDRRSLLAETAAQRWPSLAGIVVGVLAATLWPWEPSPLSVAGRVLVVIVPVYVFELLRQWTVRRAQDDERRQAAIHLEQERQRAALERLAELVGAFRPFLVETKSRSTEASVFLAATHLAQGTELTQEQRSVLAVWNEAFQATGHALSLAYEGLRDRLKRDLAEDTLSDDRLIDAFEDLAGLTMAHTRAVRAFAGRCGQVTTLPKMAVSEYKLLQQEYTLWAARFRSLRAEARKTISPKIGEYDPELVPDL